MNSNLNENEKKPVYKTNPFQTKNMLNKKNKQEDSSEEGVNSGNSSREEENDQFRTGRWQPQEHFRFIKGCLMYGNNWKKVRKNKNIV